MESNTSSTKRRNLGYGVAIEEMIGALPADVDVDIQCHGIIPRLLPPEAVVLDSGICNRWDKAQDVSTRFSQRVDGLIIQLHVT